MSKVLYRDPFAIHPTEDDVILSTQVVEERVILGVAPSKIQIFHGGAIHPLKSAFLFKLGEANPKLTPTLCNPCNCVTKIDK